MTAARPGARTAAGAARAAIVRIVIVAASLAALAYTVRSLGLGNVAGIALGADPAWLAASLAAIALRYLVWAAKWKRMIEREAPVGYRIVLRAVLAGTFANLVTPTAKLAGGVLRAVIVERRSALSTVSALGWSVADQVTNVLGDVALAGALAAGVWLTAPAGSSAAWTGPLAAGCLAVVLISLALRGPAWRLVRRPSSVRLVRRLTPRRFRGDDDAGSGTTWIESLFAPLLSTGGTWTTLPLDLLLGGGSWLCLVVANALVFRALGIDAPVLGTAAALVLAVLGGTLSGAVGGIGATEVALIALYGQSGVPASAAAAAALLHRGTYYALSLSFGAAAFVRETWSTAIRREAGAATAADRTADRS